MDAERARAFLLTLPHVVETQQWGNNLLFWVGDKALGGKMFALLDLDGDLAKGVGTFAAGAERYAELLEREGLRPAPYFARIFWVAVEHWGALRNSEWEDEWRAAHELTLSKLPKRTRETLALPLRQQSKLIAERKKQLAAREAAKSLSPPSKASGKRKTAK